MVSAVVTSCQQRALHTVLASLDPLQAPPAVLNRCCTCTECALNVGCVKSAALQKWGRWGLGLGALYPDQCFFLERQIVINVGPELSITMAVRQSESD